MVIIRIACRASSRAIGKVIATIAPLMQNKLPVNLTVKCRNRSSVHNDATVFFTRFQRVLLIASAAKRSMLNVPVTLIFKVFANNPKS